MSNPHARHQHRHHHLGHEHVAAVFPDRVTAEDGVAALRAHGLASESLGVAIHNDEPVEFERNAAGAMVHDAEVGVATGAPIGALAGLALAATGVGAVIAVGGILALGGASSLMGGVLGGYLGVAAGFTDWNEHQDFGYRALEPGEVLVVVCSHGQPDVVTADLTNSGGRLITPDEAST